MSTSIAQAKSRVGVAVRTKNTAAETAARRDLAAAKLEAYVQRVVEEAPPLTPEQLSRIGAMLHQGRVAGGAK